MYCMKCGKKIPEKQAFCENCLASMERFPVKPETRVLLPNRETPVAAKKAPVRKRNLSAEERLVRARKVIQWLIVSLVAAFLALCLSIGLLIETITPETQPGAIGQNYNTTGTEKHTD